MRKTSKLITTILLLNSIVYSQELIIGEERIAPGIVFVFEGAVKDIVFPESNNLNESQTNIHIEARVNWDLKDIPPGTPKGGFIPYLRINAIVTNQKTGLKTFIDLLPHINLIDNFHYARNISLPGDIADLYNVEFNIMPPNEYELSFHKDWTDSFSKSLFDVERFVYRNINFEKIANSSRR
ncbi:MAG: hypothetical protein CMC79_03570 [Flavobacteriaceae bacterium]|nr:hypothetical protein [Flavobacteriaceae bacterium]|tara:strand:- start:27714 stop:28259 length:546 start_codon:yes stop_codon:yes gene_type:complete